MIRFRSSVAQVPTNRRFVAARGQHVLQKGRVDVRISIITQVAQSASAIEFGGAPEVVELPQILPLSLQDAAGDSQRFAVAVEARIIKIEAFREDIQSGVMTHGHAQLWILTGQQGFLPTQMVAKLAVGWDLIEKSRFRVTNAVEYSAGQGNLI